MNRADNSIKAIVLLLTSSQCTDQLQWIFIYLPHKFTFSLLVKHLDLCITYYGPKPYATFSIPNVGFSALIFQIFFRMALWSVAPFECHL